MIRNFIAIGLHIAIAPLYLFGVVLAGIGAIAVIRHQAMTRAIREWEQGEGS